MSSYTQYLGSKRCCDLRGQGPQGAQGAQGNQSVGPVGYQGSTGSAGPQGATGRSCRGPTGAQGAVGPGGGAQGATGTQGTTGPSQWYSSNYIGPTGPGYTGIGFTGDVQIFGNLLVTGGIDPIYLALTPQAADPLPGGLDGIWIEDVPSRYLHTKSIFLNDGSNNDFVQINPNNSPQLFITDNATQSQSNSITNGSITILDETTVPSNTSAQLSTTELIFTTNTSQTTTFTTPSVVSIAPSSNLVVPAQTVPIAYYDVSFNTGGTTINQITLTSLQAGYQANIFISADNVVSTIISAGIANIHLNYDTPISLNSGGTPFATITINSDGSNYYGQCITYYS